MIIYSLQQQADESAQRNLSVFVNALHKIRISILLHADWRCLDRTARAGAFRWARGRAQAWDQGTVTENPLVKTGLQAADRCIWNNAAMEQVDRRNCPGFLRKVGSITFQNLQTTSTRLIYVVINYHQFSFIEVITRIVPLSEIYLQPSVTLLDVAQDTQSVDTNANSCLPLWLMHIHCMQRNVLRGIYCANLIKQEKIHLDSLSSCMIGYCAYH